MTETSRLDGANKLTGSRFIVILLSWTSDAAGDVSVASDEVIGKVARVTCIPGATTPTNLYDVVLNDADGQDVCAGNLANQLAAGPSGYIVPNPCPVSSVLTAVVSNAGNAKNGTIRIYVE